jgi:hypothetical protein
MTANLILNKPTDPIRNMIDQLKEIQQENETNSKIIKKEEEEEEKVQ